LEQNWHYRKNSSWTTNVRITRLSSWQSTRLYSDRKIDITEDIPRTANNFTDSRISIDSIRNTRNQSHLIEEIRKKITNLERANWNVKLSRIKAHVGIVVNELADQLAKAAASDSGAKIVFNRLPMSSLISEIAEETKLKWQKEWKECTKSVQRVYKECTKSVQRQE
jgi:hypothetical protein